MPSKVIHQKSHLHPPSAIRTPTPSEICAYLHGLDIWLWLPMAQLRLSCFDNFRTMQIGELVYCDFKWLLFAFVFPLLLLFVLLFALTLCCRALLIVFFNRTIASDSTPSAITKERNCHMIIIWCGYTRLRFSWGLYKSIADCSHLMSFHPFQLPLAFRFCFSWKAG